MSDQEHLRTMGIVERVVPQLCAVMGRIEVARSKLCDGSVQLWLTLDGTDLQWSSPGEAKDYRRLSASVVGALAEKGFVTEPLMAGKTRRDWYAVSSVLNHRVDHALRKAHRPAKLRVEAYLREQADAVLRQRTDEIRSEFRGFAQRMLNKQRIGKTELSDLIKEECDLLLVRAVLEA